MPDQPSTFAEYLAGVPPARSAEIEQVWRVIREHMLPDYTEVIGPKFLLFKADDEWYVALANQKHYMSLYLMPIYVFPELNETFEQRISGLKRGKSCINFTRAADLPLDLIGEIVGATPATVYVDRVRAIRAQSRPQRRLRA